MSTSLDERPVCRRCKKKRPVDEPLETARYRTCKPCREIERKKKRLKKLELTGREVHPHAAKSTYQQVDQIINLANQVTRNTQVPQQSQQYGHLNPPILAPLNYQPQSQHEVQQRILNQQHAQQQAQQQAQAAAQAATQAQHAISTQKLEDRDIPIDELLLKQDGQVHDSDHQDSKILTQEALEAIAQSGSHINKTNESDDNNNLFAALKNAEVDQHVQSVEGVGGLENSSFDEIKHADLNNTLDTGNVFDDFNSFLSKIVLGKVADLNSIVFIKRFEENNGIISDFKHYQDGSNNIEEITEELNRNFIDPVIGSSGLEFYKSSIDSSATKASKSIELLYKCKQDINNNNIEKSNENTGGLEIEDSEPIVYLGYDVFTKDLSIKFSHNNHKFLLEKYSEGLIDKVRAFHQENTDLEEIFDELQNLQEDALKDEVRCLKKTVFVRDFAGF